VNRPLEPARLAADITVVLRRLRSESGFLLVELLIALMLLNIGLLSIVTAFSAGSTALLRASRKATAGALADQQMELYRALTYTAIALDQTSVNSTDSTYGSDSALDGSLSNDITATTGCTGVPNQCNPSRSVTGPDHGSYRVDTYIRWTCPSGTLGGTVSAPTCSGTNASRPAKLVTIVVRDTTNLAGTAFVREASTFDQSTGS
jgi:type II secretory pathway pseudopilin PulG